MKRARISLLLTLILMLSTLLLRGARAESPIISLRVSAQVTVYHDRIKLGELAEISTLDSAINQQLSEISLGYAPEVGQVRELTREKILLAIKAGGIVEQSIATEIPAVVLIKRASQQIEASYLYQAVEEASLRELRGSGAAARLTRLDLPPTVEVVAGTTEIRASIAGVRDLFNPFIASIEIWVDGRITRRLSATAQAEAFAPVMVAARNLAAGERLQLDCVRLEACRLKRTLNYYLREPRALRGSALRRAISAGEPLTTDLVFADIVVKPGDLIRLIGQNGKIYIEAQGEARAAGRVGDRIQVKNAQSGTLLQAIVEDAGVARVLF